MSPKLLHKMNRARTSLAVQWLRLCSSNAGGAGSIPGLGNKILHGVCVTQPKIKKIKWTGQGCHYVLFSSKILCQNYFPLLQSLLLFPSKSFSTLLSDQPLKTPLLLWHVGGRLKQQFRVPALRSECKDSNLSSATYQPCYEACSSSVEQGKRQHLIKELKIKWGNTCICLAHC